MRFGFPKDKLKKKQIKLRKFEMAYAFQFQYNIKTVILNREEQLQSTLYEKCILIHSFRSVRCAIAVKARFKSSSRK